MGDTFKFDVCVSFCSKDKLRVRSLAHRLNASGLRVTFDERVIRPADDISALVAEGLNNSRTLLLCISPALLRCDHSSLERSTATFCNPADQPRRLVPLLLAPCTLPPTLRQYELLDWREGSDHEFDSVLKACQAATESASSDLADQSSTDLSASQTPAIVCRDPQSRPTRTYVSAKIVVLGDGGVGKTALAHRLIEDKFVPTESTHGMNVWPLNLPVEQNDGVTREALLWDLAGQYEYKLVHQLYLDDAALAIIVFDPRQDDPFGGVENWLSFLRTAVASYGAPTRPVRALLVAARADVGDIRTSTARINQFLQHHDIDGYLSTSAKTGENCSDSLAGGSPSALKRLIAAQLPWDELPRTSAPAFFSEITGAVMQLRSQRHDAPLVRLPELSQHVERTLGYPVSELDVRAVLTSMVTHGLVLPLPFGDLVLLSPELLNSYATAAIRAARDHPDGMGCVREQDIFTARFDLTDVDRLSSADEQLLLRALVQIFLDHSLCIAEHTPEGTVLVFPSQYRRERAFTDYPNVFLSYSFDGDLQRIYTTLVVRLWYSSEFEHHELWWNAVELKTSTGQTVGLLMQAGPGGKGTIGIFFDNGVSDEVKLVLIQFVHKHLHKYARNVQRNRRYICPRCGKMIQAWDAAVVHSTANRAFTYCPDCGEQIALIDSLEQLLATNTVAQKVVAMDSAATRALDAQALEQILLGHVMAICGESNQIFRLLPLHDRGIDGEIEFKDDSGNASGKKVYVQLKSGDASLRTRGFPRRDVFTVTDRRNLAYWTAQPVDVYLVIRTQNGLIRWMNLTQYLRKHKSTSRRQIIFTGEALDATAVWKVRDRVLGRSKRNRHETLSRSDEEARSAAVALVRTGLSDLATADLESATINLENSLALNCETADAVVGLIRVAQHYVAAGLFDRAGTVVNTLIRLSPDVFAAEFSKHLAVDPVAVSQDLTVVVRHCPVPLLHVAGATSGFGWKLLLTSNENGKDIHSVPIHAEGVGADRVKICSDARQLAWGEYRITLSLVNGDRIAWQTACTAINAEPDNPYLFGPPIKDPKYFFGRHDLITTLIQRLNRTSIALIGPRRCGKTSVLHHLGAACFAEWNVAFLDLQDLVGIDIDSVRRAVMRAIVDACHPLQMPMAITQAAGCQTPAVRGPDLWELRPALHSIGVKRLLMLVDEAGVLAEYPAVALHFRSMSKWCDPMVRFVVAGSAWDFEAVHDAVAADYRQSAFINEFTNVEMEDISSHDAADLILKPLRGLYTYDPAALDAIVQLGAGRPFFLNALASLTFKVVQSEGGRLVTPMHVEKARREAKYELNIWYGDLLREVPSPIRQELPVLIRTPDQSLPSYCGMALRNAGFTIGSRSELRIDPLFVDWWRLTHPAE